MILDVVDDDDPWSWSLLWLWKKKKHLCLSSRGYAVFVRSNLGYCCWHGSYSNETKHCGFGSDPISSAAAATDDDPYCAAAAAANRAADSGSASPTLQLQQPQQGPTGPGPPLIAAVTAACDASPLPA